MRSSSTNLERSNNERSAAKTSNKAALEATDYLNEVLANEFALLIKSLNFHWNVTGPRFRSLHLLFEEQYRELLEALDNVAERIRILGEYPLGTVQEILSVMDIKESSAQTLAADEMLATLLGDHLTIQDQIIEITKQSDLFKKDPGTEDFLIGLLQKHEKMTWMLQSHLQSNGHYNLSQ